MPVDIDNHVRVNWFGRCFGQRIILTTGYVKTAGANTLSDAAEMNLLIDDLVVGGATDLLTKYLACLPASYSMEKVLAQVVTLTRTTAVQRNIVTPGTHPDTSTVANDSACITLKGVFTGADKRSNKHIGPVPDNASTAGLLTAAFIARMAQLGDKLVSTVTVGAGLVYKPAVFKANITAPAWLLTSYSIGTQSRVQRRRTVGLGE